MSMMNGESVDESEVLGVAKAAPAVAAGAMQNPDKLAAGSKAAGDFASGWFDPGPPPPSVPGYTGSGAKWMYNKYKERK